MVGDDYGIRWLPTYTTRRRPERQLLPDLPAAQPRARRRRASVPGRRARPLTTRIYVETGRFLRQLHPRRADRRRRDPRPRFATPADIAALARAARLQLHRPRRRATCSATPSLQPVRGQLAILLPQPEIRYAFTGEAGYMFPRADGILLGGTFERGVWDADAAARSDRPHPRPAPAPVRRLPLHRLNCLVPAPI